VIENITVGELISVYSQTGMCVKTEQASGDRMEIQLPVGIYIVRIEGKVVKIAL